MLWCSQWDFFEPHHVSVSLPHAYKVQTTHNAAKMYAYFSSFTQVLYVLVQMNGRFCYLIHWSCLGKYRVMSIRLQKSMKDTEIPYHTRRFLLRLEWASKDRRTRIETNHKSPIALSTFFKKLNAHSKENRVGPSARILFVHISVRMPDGRATKLFL